MDAHVQSLTSYPDRSAMSRFATPSPILAAFLLIVGLLGVTLFSGTALAQTTFTVTVVQKTSAHPYFGQGDPEGYAIDGVEGAAVTVTRGGEYIFQMDSVPPDHPFYVSTSESGAGAGVWSDGVDGNFASGNSAVTFDVPDEAPDLLWYQCAAHAFMGWHINVIDPVGSEGASGPVEFGVRSVAPNPFAGSTTIRLDLPSEATVSVSVFDVLGRRVLETPATLMVAGPGEVAIDGGSLAAGTYIYRVVATSGDAYLSTGGIITRAH